MRRNTILAGLIVLALSLAVAGTGTAAPRLGGSIDRWNREIVGR